MPGLSADDRPEGDRVTLAGIVLSGATGEPISGATVRALGAGAESVRESSDIGEWLIECAAGDGNDRTIRVEHFLHVPREVEWSRRPRKATRVRMPPVLLLPVGAQLQGCVVGPRGEPVPFADVCVSHSVPASSSIPIEFWGRHRLRANEQGCFGPVPVPVGTVTVYANSFDLPEFGVSVFVEPGSVRAIEIEVVLPSPVFATGRVVDGEGRPLQATIVGWVREV